LTETRKWKADDVWLFIDWVRIYLEATVGKDENWNEAHCIALVVGRHAIASHKKEGENTTLFFLWARNGRRDKSNVERLRLPSLPHYSGPKLKAELELVRGNSVPSPRANEGRLIPPVKKFQVPCACQVSPPETLQPGQVLEKKD